jgi:plasmid maintenance system antidote protein VapI
MRSPRASHPDWAIPPGASLHEAIEDFGLTRAALATRTGYPLKTINRIIAGTALIRPETARRLETATGVPAGFWNNAEANYRQRLARLTP